MCTIRRTYSLATLAANTGDTLRAFAFTLDSSPNYSEFTNLFDSYRILEAVVSFIPLQNMAVGSSGTASYPGILGTVIDYDDANLPANIQQLQQYESYQRVAAYRPTTRVIKPKCANALYGGSTFTSYGNKYGQWIDTNSPSVPHYGLKCIITLAGYTASTNIYEVEAQVTYQFRSIH